MPEGVVKIDAIEVSTEVKSAVSVYDSGSDGISIAALNLAAVRTSYGGPILVANDLECILLTP